MRRIKVFEKFIEIKTGNLTKEDHIMNITNKVVSFLDPVDKIRHRTQISKAIRDYFNEYDVSFNR